MRFISNRRYAAAAFSFLAVVLTGAIVACSDLGNTTGINVGPNFPSMTLYATNTNQNAVSIYTSATKNGGGPAYQIGGASTSLNGPQYLAFDHSSNLWVTNYNASTQAATLIEFAALATGNVIPLTSASLEGRPRGIAISPVAPTPLPSSSASPLPSLMVISDVDPTITYPSQILLFIEGSTYPYQAIAGPNPGLNLPAGVALDRFGHIYVANIGGHSVSQFVLPTPTPTPKPTPTPSPTPSPSPSVTPSPSPTPSPTPTPVNVYPRFSITAKNGVMTPYSVALDTSGNIYIVDQGKTGATCSVPPGEGPAILVFPPYNKKIPYTKPIHKIQGCNTQLLAPTDIKVNSSGMIYVADTTSSGAGIIYVFAPPSGASSDPTPFATYKSSGVVTGIGLVP